MVKCLNRGIREGAYLVIRRDMLLHINCLCYVAFPLQMFNAVQRKPLKWGHSKSFSKNRSCKQFKIWNITSMGTFVCWHFLGEVSRLFTSASFTRDTLRFFKKGWYPDRHTTQRGVCQIRCLPCKQMWPLAYPPLQNSWHKTHFKLVLPLNWAVRSVVGC